MQRIAESLVRSMRGGTIAVLGPPGTGNTTIAIDIMIALDAAQWEFYCDAKPLWGEDAKRLTDENADTTDMVVIVDDIPRFATPGEMPSVAWFITQKPPHITAIIVLESSRRWMTHEMADHFTHSIMTQYDPRDGLCYGDWMFSVRHRIPFTAPVHGDMDLTQPIWFDRRPAGRPLFSSLYTHLSSS